ncbi:MAG: insulinase family protein [Elusimicrobia bacterium]|nr:insulinase family protein [Candidatus Obscuribacterium magneticum]
MLYILKDAPPPFTGAEVHTLPNGLKLVLKEDHTSPVVSLQTWVRCGAIDEVPRLNGISHGLEHMVFKGTPTRSPGDITRAIESNGGFMNAATQLETTHYFIDIPSYGAGTALEVLADTVLRPTFPQEELERERQVILEEIRRRDDNPESTLWDEHSARLFKDTPYGIKVIGSPKSVSSLTRNDLLQYHRAHYVPAKMNVVVTGDFKKGPLLKKLEKLFGPEKPKDPPPTPVVDLSKTKPTQAAIKKPVQLTYVAMGLPTPGLKDPNVIALDLLADVLGGGYSSRLYQILREKEKVVLAISCDFLSFQQKGMFGFFMEMLPAQYPAAMRSLEIALHDLATKNPIRREELNRAKARVKSDWLYGAETPHGQASTLGSLSILGEIQLIETYLKTVNALTADDLMDIFHRTVKGQKFFVTRVEPNK